MKRKTSKLLTLFLILVSSSCLFEDFGATPYIKYKTHFGKQNQVILNKDTLILESINYIISDLKLVNNGVIFVSHIAPMSRYESFEVTNKNNGLHDIAFKFGIDNVRNLFPILQDRDLRIEDGYYFLKMKFRNLSNDSIYNYEIARLNNNSKIIPFTTEIKDFNSSSLFVANANIGVDLEKLLTTPHQIDISKLDKNQIYNE